MEYTIESFGHFLAVSRSRSLSFTECLRQAAIHYPGLKRGECLPVIMRIFGIKKAYANTIFYKDYWANQRRVTNVEVTQPADPVKTNETIDTIRTSLSESASSSAALFADCTAPIPREIFLKRGGFKDMGKGCVYAYFNDQGAVYVGITSGRVKSRLNTPTSPHALANWWSSWTYMRFLPLESPSDRQILEYLLILGLAPTVNKKPGAVRIDEFLKGMGGD